MPPKCNTVLLSPVQNKLSEVKAKYSPLRRASNKHNQMYEEGFPQGVIVSAVKKKATNEAEDAYFKDFLDNLDNDSAIADKLGIIKLTFVRESAKCSIAKSQVSRYKSRQILGIAPMGYTACIIIIIN